MRGAPALTDNDGDEVKVGKLARETEEESCKGKDKGTEEEEEEEEEEAD